MSSSSSNIIDGRAIAVRVRRHTIVHDVDIQMRSNGVLGLLGANGAGKTTLMRALATAIPTTGGELRLLGVDVRNDVRKLREVRAQIGYAPQQPLVLRHLSVFDQVAYAAWLKGMKGGSADARARIALEEVDLTRNANTKTRNLSGGMLRRLGIAMAMVANPQLLLLDEPTAGLDPEQRVRFRESIARLGNEKAVVLSTHLVEDVASLCSAVVVMAGGRSIFSGSPAELAKRADGSTDDVAGITAGFAQITGMRV
jgi:ABC-2 type transport system ATP-binding protein